MPKINKEKAEKLINKGDKLFNKGKFKRALKKYQKAKKFDPERADLYDRLVNAHDAATGKWKEEDVVESVGFVMKKQEIENPFMKLLHAKLTPEFTEIVAKISSLIVCTDDEEEMKIVEEIKAYGEDAIYPLIFTIIQIKKGAASSKETELPNE